jgi:hypothetical protein
MELDNKNQIMRELYSSKIVVENYLEIFFLK